MEENPALSSLKCRILFHFYHRMAIRCFLLGQSPGKKICCINQDTPSELILIHHPGTANRFRRCLLYFGKMW